MSPAVTESRLADAHVEVAAFETAARQLGFSNVVAGVAVIIRVVVPAEDATGELLHPVSKIPVVKYAGEVEYPAVLTELYPVVGTDLVKLSIGCALVIGDLGTEVGAGFGVQA